MSTYQMDCADAAATEAFGQRLGKQLQGGEVIELVGDVGAGKTTFVRGLARGLDSPEHVSSPTFTVSHVYQGRLALHHLDLYRLTEPGLLSHQVSELLEESNTVLVIEWGNEIVGVLPEQRIIIRFQVTDSEARKLEILIPKALDYMTC